VSSTQQNPSHIYNAAGNYTVTFIVTDSQSTQDSISLTINATLSSTPAYLSCSPTNLYFGIDPSGILTANQSLRIINAGDGTMIWNLGESIPWLSCFPISGINRGQVFISVNASALSPGTYNATITVSSPQAYNSPQLIEVNLRVYEPGLGSDPSGEANDLLDGTPVAGRVTIAGWTLVDARVKKVGTKTNSDPNNLAVTNASHGLVSRGGALMADNSAAIRDLSRPELKSNDLEDEIGRLEIGLMEIWKGLELQYAVDRDTEEHPMTVDQAEESEPRKDRLQLNFESETTNSTKVQIDELEPLRIVFTSSIRENICFIGWGEDENSALPIGSALDTAKGEFSWIPQSGSIGQYILHFAVSDGSHRSQPLLIEVNVIQKTTTKK
jgi:PKD repeat protein